MTPIEFSTFEVIAFLLIDFVIFAAIVAAVFFLVLYFKTKKLKRVKIVDLNDLEAFKNKNLENETNVSIEQNRPVAPSTINSSNDFRVDVSVNERGPKKNIRNNDADPKMFHCQMKQNEQSMNDTFASSQGKTNYINM